VVTDPRDPGAVVPDSREMAVLAAGTAADKQGQAVVVLDVRELITITDYFVICSGATDRQVKTLADEIVKALKGRGVRPVRREGEVAARWVLLDFVDFVVHVFNQEEREFYRLENLWRDAPIVRWEERADAAGSIAPQSSPGP
jgi:ribosome-associated protein